ncbi:hypothetical protein BGZ95_008408 [Linnemannia exigua]|uniref:Uncharacterized protein n=1 Tax=Linnemannia exigua TaxID=604196 RepID=A0AAD4HB54_9FUNG|nr:hypothetical protein BGZ95_008408 [Linnemannia exigua]
MNFTIDSWDPSDEREVLVQLFLNDMMRLNISLTDLSLHTQLVIEFEDEFTEAFMSLSQLRSLTVSVFEAAEPTHPRALKMLLQLGQHHPSLQSIDFGGVYGGWRPCIAFRPDHMTEDDYEELDRRDEKHDQEEEELMETTAEQFKKTPSSNSGITFPRIHRLELPPRRYYPYPESFLKALRREVVAPNLCSLIAPKGTRHGESAENRRGW